MLSVYKAVDLALHDAVKAYVTDDRKLATKTKKRTLSIDARCANLEAVCYNLIATQSPVASDFRLLQTIIYVDFNLQRMTDKVRQICRATRHMVNADISLPQELVGTVGQGQGHVPGAGLVAVRARHQRHVHHLQLGRRGRAGACGV